MMKRFVKLTLACSASALALIGTASAQEGFSITIDDEPYAGDPLLSDTVRQVDQQLAEAELQVKFDGLGVTPRLTLLVLNSSAPKAGDTAHVRSELNYPAFVTRGELRLIETGALGGARTVKVVPLAPNGEVKFTMPEGEGIVISHRVYDRFGRYDETVPSKISPKSNVGTSAKGEAGVDTVGRRRIPVRGGAVTVSGSNVVPGGTIRTLNESVVADRSGSFVIQRILPPGDHAVGVSAPGTRVGYLERQISIPQAEWFVTAQIDLTFGRKFQGGSDTAGGPFERDYGYGRVAGYITGKTANGWDLTARIDTGEDEFKNLFKDLDEKDPQARLRRMMLEDAYPTYGDDSTLIDGAPSDGKIYLRAERDGSHLLWGNYKSEIENSTYLRNERTLYGAQALYRSPLQTQRGESRVAAEVYAASPDRLPGREYFDGTGGSVYFLARDDLMLGSETISVELRDKRTGRLISTRQLVHGQDYEIDYSQGVVTLVSPLSSFGGSDDLVSEPGGDQNVRLAVQYEYTPGADLDGLSYGGRVEAWATDSLRFGVTGMVEQTDIADQTAFGADVRLQFGEESFVELEYAETEGPGFGSSISSDGGLIVTTTATAGLADGTGEAWRTKGQAEFADLGLAMPGRVTGYYEKRSAGFSTLDYQIANDEELWGVTLEAEPTERLSFRLYADDYSDITGKELTELGAEVSFKVTDRVTLDLGVEQLDKVTPGGDADETGRRTDAAVRVTYKQSDDLTLYAFGQHTLSRSGGLKRNDRYGAGAKYRFAQNWTVEGEVSDGTDGFGADLIFNYQSDGYDSAYFGYRLEPGRALSGVTLKGSDSGRFVLGGKRQVSDDVKIYGENTYDVFGAHRSLVSAYGVEYDYNDYLTFSGGFEMGRIDDDVNGDYERNAFSIGARYDDGDALNLAAKLEYRRDRGITTATLRDADAWRLAASGGYKIDESHRFVFSIDHTNIESVDPALDNGIYTDAVLGYAFRPIEHDRLNMLFQYRYFHDSVGQIVDNTSERGTRQESHILSFDVEYDLSPKWTLGGKVGLRKSLSSPSEGVAFQQNDAGLAVLNARYHAVHNWDMLFEARHLEAKQASVSETSFLGAVYRHLGENAKIGVGYNFGSFSDDLTDMSFNDEGAFLNVVAKF